MLVNQHMTITITFNGLLVFAFNNGEKPLYEIGVLKVSDPPHLLRINRLTTDPAGHTQIFPEIADKIQSGDLYLEVPERNGREGVSRYSGNAQATDEDPQDFDLLIDLEKREPGDPALNLKPGFPSQSIFVNQGVFYTYQPARVLLKSPNGETKNTTVANMVGCDLQLIDGENFVLKPGPDNLIELQYEAGVRHLIQITNLPPDSDNDGTHAHHGHDHPGMPGSSAATDSHFHNYYGCAVELPEGEKPYEIIDPVTSHPSIFTLGPKVCPGVQLGMHQSGLPRP